MLSIPADLEASHPSRVLPEASVVLYRNDAGLSETLALVTRPTFVWVQSGTKHLRPGGGQRPIRAESGSLVCMRSGTHVMSEFVDREAGYRSVVLSVRRDFLRTCVGQLGAADGQRRVVRAPVGPHVEAAFGALLTEPLLELEDAERLFRLRTAILAALSDERVRRLMYQEAAEWGASAGDRVRAVVASHLHAPLDVPDYAALCAMSLSTFKRHFRQVHGMAPGRWIAQMRLRHARALAVDTEQSIAEICFESGYRDVSNFIRAFRREYGMTPGAMRKAGRGAP